MAGEFDPSAYPPPQAADPPPAQRATNGFAIASLVLGIMGASILALVFGYIARSQIDRSGGVQGGRGLAIAGIVLGWVGVAFGLIVLVVLLATVSS